MGCLLLETDQIGCYDAAGRPVPCEGSGQDAVRPKKGPASADRFQTQGEVVLDVVTGALWSRNSNPADFPLTWDEACDVAAAMAARRMHGHAHWQLPSRRLLFSLISHQAVNPALPGGHPFTNVFSGYYWTAESCHRFPEQVWHIHLGGGRVTRANKQDASLVWPVSLSEMDVADVFKTGERFVLEGETARDIHTGLIWSRDADPVGGPLSWEESLSAMEVLNRAALHGATDWRVPTIRELESLVDLSADSPALQPGHPFLNVRDAYWSSTTSLYEPRYAWAFYTRDGMVGVGFKPDAGFHLWPVRGNPVASMGRICI